MSAVSVLLVDNLEPSFTDFGLQSFRRIDAVGLAEESTLPPSTQYKMRAVVAPNGIKQKVVFWDSPDIPDMVGVLSGEVQGDLVDIGVAWVE